MKYTCRIIAKKSTHDSSINKTLSNNHPKIIQKSSLGASWSGLWASWCVVGAWAPFVGRLVTVLGLSWGVLEASWRYSGSMMAHLGVAWKRLEGAWGASRGRLGAPRAVWKHPGGSWRHFRWSGPKKWAFWISSFATSVARAAI